MSGRSWGRRLVGAAVFIAILSILSLIPLSMVGDRKSPRRGDWWRRMQAVVNATLAARRRGTALLERLEGRAGGTASDEARGPLIPGGGAVARLDEEAGGHFAEGTLDADTASGGHAVYSTQLNEAKDDSHAGAHIPEGTLAAESAPGGHAVNIARHNETDVNADARAKPGGGRDREQGGEAFASNSGTAKADGKSKSMRARARVEALGNGTARAQPPPPRRQRGISLPISAPIVQPNPSIPQCNVPDVELVPNAWPNLVRKGSGQGRGHGLNCSFWATDRSNATFKVLMRGRMANVMLQYLWVRIKADVNGWGIANLNGWTQKSMALQYPIHFFAHVGMDYIKAAPLAKVSIKGCGPHYQQYGYFRNERCLAQCIFSRRRNANMSHHIFQELGPNDVVIHYREPTELIVPVLNRRNETWNNTMPPFEFYSTILTRLKERGELGKIWIAAQFDFTFMHPLMKPNNTALEMILKKFGGEVIYGTSEQDHYVARQAPIFIGSFGTYSWTIAYLSSAREIYLPYDSTERDGSTWARWGGLWIDDDPRIRYHDCFGQARFQSASEVAQMDSVFGAALRAKPLSMGRCDPKIVDSPALRYWPTNST